MHDILLTQPNDIGVRLTFERYINGAGLLKNICGRQTGAKMTVETDRIEALVARTDTLEATVAYQSEAIEDLNKTITDQWKVIDMLKRSLDVLSDRVQEADSPTGLSAPEPPPP